MSEKKETCDKTIRRVFVIHDTCRPAFHRIEEEQGFMLLTVKELNYPV